MPPTQDLTQDALLEIVTIPCLSDNYAFLILSPDGATAALVDAPEAAPIQAELDRRGLTLSDILITHHHDDHIGAVSALAGADTRVVGAKADIHRLPPLHLSVGDGDVFDLFGAEVRVMDVSGHTVGHIAYYLPAAKAVFTADSLMALGCGRLFEGTAQQMWGSLLKLVALPRETLVCSGHEYTQANARFALSIEPENPDLVARAREIDAARDAGRATVPSTLAEELATNPFLRAGLPKMKATLGMDEAVDADVFAEIRRRKDVF
jgi:hydroxyacylglutathione hydrolase